MKTVRVDMTRYSGASEFVTRLDRDLEGQLVVGDRVSVVDDSVDPQAFVVAEVSQDGRRVRLVRD